jgi:hypothetical protein
MSGALDVGVAPAAGASIGIVGTERTIAASAFDRWLMLRCSVACGTQKVPVFFR